MLALFIRFLWLGCLGFGGPAAHIALFRQTFVERLGWLSQAQFAHQLALCQLLPGPASSQLGFAIGRQRAGLPGALAAFAGFTLPSFLLMLGAALLGAHVLESSGFALLVQGLKLLALVVVADAVLAMGRQFCTTPLHQGIMVSTAAALWCVPGLATQFAALLLAALLAALKSQGAPAAPVPLIAPRWGWLGLFGLLLLLPPLLGARLFGDCYLAGTLVFGGGHVVLPLLQQTLGSQLGDSQFLSGYALAQLVPGPMFTLTTYLGALAQPEMPVWGALLATLGIFLPGFLLLLALAPLWQGLLARPRWLAAVGGINAAVVGLLLAALYQPVFVSAVQQPAQLALAAWGLFALRTLRVPVLPLAAMLIALNTLVY